MTRSGYITTLDVQTSIDHHDDTILDLSFENDNASGGETRVRMELKDGEGHFLRLNIAELKLVLAIAERVDTAYQTIKGENE